MIDAIAEAEGISISSKHFKAMVGKGNFNTQFVNFQHCSGAIRITFEVYLQLITVRRWNVDLLNLLVAHFLVTFSSFYQY
jgi:hypothetical protein